MMADLRIQLAGIASPNPFWLASAPPTNTAIRFSEHLKRAGAERYGRRWAIQLLIHPRDLQLFISMDNE